MVGCRVTAFGQLFHISHRGLRPSKLISSAPCFASRTRFRHGLFAEGSVTASGRLFRVSLSLSLSPSLSLSLSLSILPASYQYLSYWCLTSILPVSMAMEVRVSRFAPHHSLVGAHQPTAFAQRHTPAPRGKSRFCIVCSEPATNFLFLSAQ